MNETQRPTEKDRIPHTHGGTDAPECTRYGVRCQPAEDDRTRPTPPASTEEA